MRFDNYLEIPNILDVTYNKPVGLVSVNATTDCGSDDGGGVSQLTTMALDSRITGGVHNVSILHA